MKKLFHFLFAALALVAISCASNTSSDQEAEVNTAYSVDSLLANADQIVDSLVEIQGVCTHTCRHGATKMFLIGTDDSKTIRVEACELGSFSPDVVNSLVNVKGYLREQRIDEQYLAQWEEQIKANQDEKHGEAGTGCESERAARGVESTAASDQVEELRQRIAARVADGGNPWISFYYVDAVEYEVN